MIRRLEIAQSMLHRPPLLFLDEPTVGLDPNACRMGVVVIVILGASVFSTFSLIIACLVKTRERFMGIGQVWTMPLFFASNAIYPIVLIPNWLKAIARLTLPAPQLL